MLRHFRFGSAAGPAGSCWSCLPGRGLAVTLHRPSKPEGTSRFRHR